MAVMQAGGGVGTVTLKFPSETPTSTGVTGLRLILLKIALVVRDVDGH
jgi:hypothetical protein